MTEFKPDWTVAPALLIQETLRHHGLTVSQLAAAAGPAESQAGREAVVRAALGREPLTEECAAVLAAATGVRAEMWLSLERLYRDGLTEGLTDVTPEDDGPAGMLLGVEEKGGFAVRRELH